MGQRLANTEPRFQAQLICHKRISACRRWRKLRVTAVIAPDARYKQSHPLLRHAIVSSIHDLPSDTIPDRLKFTDDLTKEFALPHAHQPLYILSNEVFRPLG